MIQQDIRNDLNILLGRLELLSEHIDQAGTEYFEITQNSAGNATKLIQTTQDDSEILLQE